VTYLATEMLLYLLSTALIGFVLGWLIWGIGQRRKISRLRADLVGALESERASHQEVRIALDSAEAKTKKAVRAAESSADRALGDMQQAVETERMKTEEAESALNQMRMNLEETIQQSRVSGQQALNQAMQAVESEKAMAADAIAKEAQSRAQNEELRLLIGTERRAAETARAELEDYRADMQALMGAERDEHRRAKIALADIRSALTRTLGADTLSAIVDDGPGEHSQSDPAAALSFKEDSSPIPSNPETNRGVVDEALDAPTLDEIDIEDREDPDLTLPPTIETALEPGPDVEPSNGIELVDPPSQPGETIELKPVQAELIGLNRPALFNEQRSDNVDNLQAIEGIGSEIERRLHENGCYRYRQLAELTSDDMDWLAQAIDVPPYQINADRWIEQAKTLQSGPGHDGAYSNSADRENAPS